MKLVRDNFDPNRERSRYALSHDEYRIFLRAKLVEEATEVMTAIDPGNLVEEIGDVLDVLDEIISEYQIDLNQIDARRHVKNSLKGGFKKGVIKLR